MNLANEFRAEADKLAKINLTEQIEYLRAQAMRLETNEVKEPVVDTETDVAEIETDDDDKEDVQVDKDLNE